MNPFLHGAAGDPQASAPVPAAGTPGAPLALAVDLEPATAELISLWLSALGWSLSADARQPGAVSLVLVEMAFPRHADHQRLRALAAAWPGVPVIVLSPTFFADVPRNGDVARQLGVAAVLATPVTRDSLVAAVQAVLGQRA